MAESQADIELEARRLVDSARLSGVNLRVLGGLAVKFHCPSSNLVGMARPIPDMDFVVEKKGGGQLEKFFQKMGYVPDREMNTLNGSKRQLFYDRVNGHQVDIFVGNFEMCHRIPFADRLEVEPLTIPLAELFLTKTQIVQLNRKDIHDLAALLLDHPIGNGDIETINLSIISGLCATDWGLFTTTMISLEKILEEINKNGFDLEESQRGLIQSRINFLQEELDLVPKSRSWKTRSVIGRRICWYNEVEEIRQ